MSIRGKNIVVLGMALFMLLSMTGISLAGFSDIQDHWASSQIQLSVQQGLVSGYPDGCFKPDNNITRAEFISIVNRAYKFTSQAAIDYSDVPADAWFAGDIAKASSAGYLSGYNDGTMRPDQPISRQEVAAIIARISQLDTTASLDAADKFKDAAAIPAWSKVAIGAVAAQGYMNGYPDQSYRPTQPITRAEAVVTLDNIMNIQVPKEASPSEPGVTVSGDESNATDNALSDASDEITPADVSSGEENDAAAPSAPSYVSSQVNNKGDISIVFSKAMANPSGKQAQFTVRVGDVEQTITGVQATKTATQIKLILAQKVTSGQVVTIAYTKGEDAASQITAADGGILDSFGPVTVKN
jgi:hypothetical protein